LNKLEFSSPKDNLYQVWFNLACWFWRFKKKIQCIFTLSLLSPLGEGISPFFEQTWVPFIQGWFVPSLVKIGPVVLEIFKWPHPIFVIISPLKRTWPFIWTNLNSLLPRIICTKFDWIWTPGSEDLNFQCVFTLSLLSPLGEGLSPSFQ
jgi:hypothetical protein